MTRSRSQIETDLSQAEAAAEAYQRDIDEAMEGRRTALAEAKQHRDELARTHYGDAILEHLVNDSEVKVARLLPDCGATGIVNFISIAADGELNKVEVYVSLDRAFLEEQGVGGNTEMLQYLWPVAATIDSEGDVTLHVTSGDRAQS